MVVTLTGTYFVRISITSLDSNLNAEALLILAYIKYLLLVVILFSLKWLVILAAHWIYFIYPIDNHCCYC